MTKLVQKRKHDDLRNICLDESSPLSSCETIKYKLIFLLSMTFIVVLLAENAHSSFTMMIELRNAAEKGDVETVRKLIEQGADVNATESSAYKPLTRAAYKGNKEVVELLIVKGADVNAKDSAGLTPLLWALLGRHMEVAEILLAKGADPNIPDKNGKTPRMYAEERGFTSMFEKATLKTASVGSPSSANAKAKEIARPTQKEQAVFAVDLQEEAGFEKAAQDYRKATKKPAFPEEARKFKVQAELSVQEKQFQKAAELYGKALEIAPWWPEGHFNRALILGETGSYQGAMREMKRYLILVPNAPNARAAQDKIYQWELKAAAAAADIPLNTLKTEVKVEKVDYSGANIRGRIKDKYGSGLFGDIDKKNYIDRLSQGAELELLDRKVYDHKTYGEHIHVKVLNDNGYGKTAIGKTGWLPLSDTDFQYDAATNMIKP